MASLCKSTLLSLFFVASLSVSTPTETDTFSFSFPLSSHRLEHNGTKSLFSSSLFSRAKRGTSAKTTPYAFKTTFKYSMALIVSLPIGTPPQAQQMVLDTGSQLSWIQCHKVRRPPPTTSFNPSMSSTFSVLPCSHPICKPRIPDFTLPTSCDQNRLCHYSYFYADGTYAEGNLVREKFTFSKSQSTPPLTLGCSQDSTDDKGILGMNLGRLSFASQAKITKFSYCVPVRGHRSAPTPTGSFYLGSNPSSRGFTYIEMLTFPQSQRMPNLDPLAYTLPLVGISIGRKKLPIPATVFRPSPGGAGQTMIDSGSEFTYLVDEAYDKVRQEVVRLVGPRLKKGFIYGGVADMCFDVKAVGIERSIGDMVFQFERGAQIVVPRERMLAHVGDGAKCVAIARSEVLGAASNIIGNFHQQNLWVEFDLTNRRVGFGRANCTRSL